MRRRAGTVSVCGLLVTLTVALPAVGEDQDSSLYADCWYASKPGQLTVRTENSEDAYIRRRGRRVDVLAPGRTACKGGRATTRNTRRIKFVLAGGGITEGHLDLRGGLFVPGRGAEQGKPEIEVSVIVPSSQSEFHLDGRQGADRFRAGDLGRTQGINLNPAVELLAPDTDVRLRGRAFNLIWFETGRGADTIDLAGGPEFRGPIRVRFVGAELGPGNDSYVGSSRLDFVLSGRGRDTVSTLGGDDLINVRDGVAETVDCGPGEDRIDPDELDVYVNCENVGFVGFFD